MTDTDPYATPKALVHDPISAPGRPVWVWIILAFYVFAVFTSVASYAVVISGAIDIPEEQQKLLSNMSAFDHVMGFSILVLRLVAAIQLVRLKRISAYLFPSALIIGVLYFVWRLATKGSNVVLANVGIIPQLIGWIVSISICVYAWRLLKRRVIK